MRNHGKLSHYRLNQKLENWQIMTKIKVPLESYGRKNKHYEEKSLEWAVVCGKTSSLGLDKLSRGHKCDYLCATVRNNTSKMN